MPAEIVLALISFIALNIGGAGAVTRALLRRQAKKIEATALKVELDVQAAADAAAEALKDREEARRKDREADEQKRLQLEAQLAHNRGQNELLINVATAVMKQTETMSAYNFKTQEAVTNLSQSNEDLIRSVDIMAGEVGTNNAHTKAVVSALKELTTHLTGQFTETNRLITEKAADIIRLLEHPADELPDVLPRAAGE